MAYFDTVCNLDSEGEGGYRGPLKNHKNIRFLSNTGLELIKLEYSFKLKIKRID